MPLEHGGGACGGDEAALTAGAHEALRHVRLALPALHHAREALAAPSLSPRTPMAARKERSAAPRRRCRAAAGESGDEKLAGEQAAGKHAPKRFPAGACCTQGPQLADTILCE